MASKYDRLYDHLNGKTVRSVTLSFRAIEKIIGAPLPASARKHSAWWANETGETRHVQSHAWLRAGRKAFPNLSAHTVDFLS